MGNMEIKKGGFYLRTANNTESFTKGSVYKSNKDGFVINDNGNEHVATTGEFTDKIAVHTPTQEDVEYVASKLSIEMDWVENGTTYKDSLPNVYVSLFSGKWGDKYTFEKHHAGCNYRLISIDQFRALFPTDSKVYIRGHATRGAEVIAKLESLGGVNHAKWNGISSELYYFIDDVLLINYETAPPEDHTEIFLDEPVAEEHGNKPLDSNGTCIGTFNPQPHYDNSKGSLYKVANERGWNSYTFDVVKRLDRGGKKDPLKQEIEKSIDVLKLWLIELEG